ncbi:MAG TPA: Gfo/Idh/MocA family oxidoreductase [Candidatus Hydrogenedentes bacterium]|nr:Gfo/Idh/MocA family oxidoreductase [Candidatus Hydrogenedentota bacterium]HOL76586.1 Gfo/Idh/MocA family oxidoreductase [Candidatus Hydrogenedentota bacterium]HPO84419.1 Gfo/Idh/MocA family oxidoreductase [Candidatus Hydrogenedentota bacterium]
MRQVKFSRRVFIFGTALAATGCVSSKPKIRRVSANEKLNIAGIGVGGQGKGDLRNCGTENIVALCDVDWNRAADTFKTFPNAKRYKDFRVMLEKEKDIDAVVISTPDHTHAVAAMAAMELGKHVRVQKPLTHSIYEARKLMEAARRYGVSTAMGNQGHSGDGVRQMCEILWSDAIGFVREVHIWTNRPVWPQGIKRPAKTDPVPDYLDWDLWLGPAPERPYVNIHPDTNQPCYCPFVWRGWWDFGCGALGDMACHIMDPAYWSLQLGLPTKVECVTQEGNNSETCPVKSIIKYEFPARPFRENYPSVKWYGKTLPPVTVYWYDGGLMPPRPEGVSPDEKLGDGDNGSYFVGEKGVATTGCYGGDTRLVPAAKMQDFKMPDPVIPRVPDGNSHQDWIRSCKDGKPHCANFDYASPFTEVVLLGNLAVRSGAPIEWDSGNMRVTNVPEANQFVKREYRKGWTL